MKLRKQMGYKKQGGYNNDQFINDSKYIMPRVYNTEKKWAEKLGMSDKFISWDAYRNIMSADFETWAFELRKYTIALLNTFKFELESIELNNDGTIANYGVCVKTPEEYKFFMNNCNLIMNTSIEGIYRLFTDKNSPVKVA